jgi:DnaJ-class molecular chaperone
MAKPHMVICEKCHGDVEATHCIPCEGKGYIVVWETFISDITESGQKRQAELAMASGGRQ